MTDLRSSSFLLRYIATLALLILGSRCALAIDPLRLSGSVSDPSGAVVSGATVSIQKSGSSDTQSTQTDDKGEFNFQLPPGKYRIEIAAAGFGSYQQGDLNLDPTAPLHMNVVLHVEVHQESVEVNVAGPQMDLSSTQVGESMGQEKLMAVPLNGRSFTDLLGLQAGVIPQSSKQSNAVVMSGCTTTPPSGDLNPGDVSVSGQRETANGFAVNGSSVEEDFNNIASVVPNLDSIAEFRVLTSNFDAEYGNFSGGQVLVITKAGTNHLHGSAFEFFRNTDFDATNYLARERAAYDRNQFGGTLGGHILRDRLLYFGDYQGTKMTQGVETGHIAVPSLANRAGDLRDQTAQLTGRVSGDYLANLLSQRLGRTITTGEPYYTATCTESNTTCVFPNGTIPYTAWSAPASALLNYIPAPNTGTNVFSTSRENQTLTDNKAALRLDWRGKAGDLSGYYFRDVYELDNPYPTAQGGADVPGFNAISRGRAQLVNLGWTKPGGVSLVNELHVSYLRNANKIGEPVGGVGPKLAAQGFVEGAGTLGIVPLNPAVEGIENVAFNDFTIGVDVTGERQVNNTYQVTEALSKALGRHTFKVGGDWHIDQVNIDSNSINNGSFVFQGSETGLDFADYLIGVASTYEQGDASGFYIRNKYSGLFAQDTWQARNNLTLNYGLRWDMLPPWREKYNQLQTLVLDQQSEVYPGAPRGMVFPGDRGVPSTLSPTKWTNLSPRFGVAYSPNWSSAWAGRLIGGPGQTSLRAGYGVFYTAFEGLSAGIMSACPPYGYDYDSTVGHPLFDEPFVSASTGATNGQPFPSPIPAFGASRQHPNTTVDWSKYSPITGDPAFYYQNASPYTENYNASIERELGHETMLSLGYVGARAHHLLVLTPASPGNAELCLSVGDPSQVAPGTNTCGPFSEGGLFTRKDGSVVEARGPFGPEFDGITYQKTIGWSNYNALEITLKHHSRAGEILGAYTYAKSLDNSSSLSEEVDPIEPGINKAISAFDVRHNFEVSYIAPLPLDKVLPKPQALSQGWTLSGITRMTTGMPVTLYNNDDTSLIGSMPNGINNNGVDTPNYLGGNLHVNLNPRNGRPACDTSRFAMPMLGQIGSAPRRFFYGPGMDNFDMALEKKITLGESRALLLRAESFNVFNHAQFFGPEAVNGNPDSITFGRIVNAEAPRQIQIAAKFTF